MIIFTIIGMAIVSIIALSLIYTICLIVIEHLAGTASLRNDLNNLKNAFDDLKQTMETKKKSK